MKRLTGLILSLMVLASWSHATADIKVYDSANQFLGILVQQAIQTGVRPIAMVYNPQLNAVMGFSYATQDDLTYSIEDLYNSGVFYSQANCQGDKYFGDDYFTIFPQVFKYDGAYYVTRTSVVSLSYLSYKAQGTCYNLSSTIPASPLVPVTLPVTEPFQAPFRFEYEAPGQTTRAVVIPLSE